MSNWTKQPENQQDYQPNAYVQSQPENQQDYQPNAYVQSQPENRQDYQPNAYVQSQPENQRDYQPNTYVQSQPEYQPEGGKRHSSKKKRSKNSSMTVPKNPPMTVPEIIVIVLLWLLIAAYPLVNSFLGIDLGDTGIHMYSYERLFLDGDRLSFTAYFTNIIGWTWLKLFPGLGLWGLNLLEVLLEIILAVIVYWLMKPYLGRVTTMIGILVALVGIDTYLNVFNYHQWNVFLLTLLMAFEFYAITRDRYRYSVLAGVTFAILVASRMGSVTAIVTFAMYFLWCWTGNCRFSKTLKHIGVSILGALGVVAAVTIGLILTGQLEFFIANVFRLKGLATASSGGYSFGNLLNSFVFGNLNAIASGAIFLGAFVILFLGMSLLLRKAEQGKIKFLNIFFGLIVLGISFYLFYYSFDVNPAPSWPQMTTGPAFTIGVLYVACAVVLLYHMMAADRKTEVFYLCVMAFFLPLLTIAGSNTGTKHVVLGLWLIAPIAVYAVKEALLDKKIIYSVGRMLNPLGFQVKWWAWAASITIMCLFFLGKFCHMAYVTSNFDSINRTELAYEIHNEKTKFLRTTKREADSINGVLETITEFEDYQDRPLIVYGGTLLFYSMLDMPSYVQYWYTNPNYKRDVLLEDFTKAQEVNEEFPVVIYCKTNNYYGFGEDVYSVLEQAQRKNGESGKKELLIWYMDDRNYTVAYENDYYAVIVPEDLKMTDDTDYRRFMVPQP